MKEKRLRSTYEEINYWCDLMIAISYIGIGIGLVALGMLIMLLLI